MNEVSSNIISEAQFSERISKIFNEVADSVSRTLGPYGKTTIIEKFGEMHVTKDGWTVLKAITYDNNTDNNILYLLTKIASQVVIKVGDGSTTSIIATREILKAFKENTDKLIDINFGPRDLTNTMEKIIKLIVKEIEARRTVIDGGSYNEEKEKKIYNLAMISTNGNETISNIISDIYSKTNNPSISFVKGNYAEHTYEIVEGYKFDIKLLDAIYITSENGNRVDLNPIILLFDHRFEIEYYNEIVVPLRSVTKGRPVYIVAPHYSDIALQRIKADTTLYYKASGGHFNEIYARASIISNNSRQLYQDLSVLLGATIIDTTAIEELMKLDEIMRVDKLVQIHKGECEKITIDTKDALFSGFTNMSEDLYNVAVNDATYRYNEANDTAARMDVVSPELINHKVRLSKLRCKMGIINVGGVSTLEQSANYDLVDDAVKACENAYLYGYNIGCSLIIPLTIQEILYPPSGAETSLNQKESLIAGLLSSAFLNVYKTIVRNKYESFINGVEDIVDRIVEESLEKKLPYDLVKHCFNPDIINPCRTDIEVLKGAASMVSLLLTSNQYIQIRLPNQH